MPFNLLDHIPDCPVMGYMWVGCLKWAVSEPDIVARFQAETGVTIGRTPLDRMIDAASGNDAAVVEKFVVWFGVNVWGDENGPAV